MTPTVGDKIFMAMNFVHDIIARTKHEQAGNVFLSAIFTGCLQITVRTASMIIRRITIIINSMFNTKEMNHEA